MNYSIIVIKASPNSRHKGYKVMPDGTIKIYHNSACDKGKANLELIEYLANFLNVNLQEIEIIGGFASKVKRIKILNKNLDYIQQKFAIVGAQQKIL
jgi:uncharacterized protein YggU (UPF0235/DUF167 family)